MIQAMKTRLKNEKGLTLVELLAVIVILAIVAAIAIPAIGNIIENSRYNAVKADAVNVLNGANIYFTDNPEADSLVTVAQLSEEGYLEAAGKLKDSEVDAKITKASGGNTITTKAIEYSGEKTLKFENATIDDINNDPEKGSSGEDNKTISGSSN